MQKLPMFYGTLLLTGVNLLLRLCSTGFQVYLSGAIGAAGIGLLQLVLSLGGMAQVAAMAGIRTSTMYLTAEDIGRQGSPKRATVRGCLCYSLCWSLAVGALVYALAPFLARFWIGHSQTAPALRLLSLFLPVYCLCGVLTGYYTACQRIGLLAGIEVGEQLLSMAITWTALRFYAGDDAGRACQSVVLGSGCGSILTFSLLAVLLPRQKDQKAEQIPTKRILRAALPLAMADNLRTGITTAENLLVPRRLALFTAFALASYGTVCGMVFPVMMFPAAVLFSLAELLIPELARCAASQNTQRVQHLVSKSLGFGLLYGLFWGGMLTLLGSPLALTLYGNFEASYWLPRFSLLVPMLYCDAIVDACIKGLGQQVHSVRYNIFTNIIDLALLYVLLPVYGLDGYYFSFLCSHAINFFLSVRRLRLCSGVKIPLYRPILAIFSASVGVFLGMLTPSSLHRMGVFGVTFCACCQLTGVTATAHWKWLRQLFTVKKVPNRV